MPLSLIPGGYAEVLLGSPFGPIGAFVGTAAIAAILNFLLCLLTLRMTGHITKLESTRY